MKIESSAVVVRRVQAQLETCPRFCSQFIAFNASWTAFSEGKAVSLFNRHASYDSLGRIQ
jgi:hypothetical protein